MAEQLTQKRVDEAFHLKRRQIISALAQANQLHRHAELLLNLEDNAALGGAIQLAQLSARDIYNLTEHARLRDTVLANRGIQYQQYLVHVGLLFYYALDLAQLIHQTSRGV